MTAAIKKDAIGSASTFSTATLPSTADIDRATAVFVDSIRFVGGSNWYVANGKLKSYSILDPMRFFDSAICFADPERERSVVAKVKEILEFIEKLDVKDPLLPLFMNTPEGFYMGNSALYLKYNIKVNFTMLAQKAMKHFNPTKYADLHDVAARVIQKYQMHAITKS